MGTDYDKRKGAKRAWKKVAAKGAEKVLADEKTKRRDRKKRKGRRLCQGMCYKDPTITDEDLQWNGKADNAEGAAEVPSDIEDDVTAERKRSHASATSSFHANPAVQLVLEEARLEAKGSKKAKLQLLGENENDVVNSNKPQQTSTKAPPDKPEPQQQTWAKSGKKEEPKKKGSGKEDLPVVRLSTGVHLLDPVAATDHANAQTRAQAAARAGAEGARVMEPEALQRFPTLIQRFMVSQGFVEPTPIQAACWPPSCSGQDVLGVAEPGSGKTLAYLLPGIIKLQAAGHSNETSPDTPPMLVLTPTRELALQVAATCRHVQKLTGLRTACIYGGVPKEQQVEVLQKHPHIVVATPGRLLDLIDDHSLRIGPAPTSNPIHSSASSNFPAQGAGSKSAQNGANADGGKEGGSETGTLYVVLDEADKMLSLGFQPQLERLRCMVLQDRVGENNADGEGQAGAAKKKGKKAQQQQQQQQQQCGSRRPQVLMFTATMPQDTAAAASSWLLPTAHRAIISGGSAAASISSTVTQVVQVCAEHKKPAKLSKHLQAIKAKSAGMRNPPRILVFANRVKTVRFLHDTLSKEGYRVVMLHGERSQPERDDAMRSFRGGKAQIMVATDVAARGLDIRQLPYVVNYDFPSSLETYVHRVGRTGRLAAFGHAFSFFTRNLARIASPLISLLQQHNQAIDPNLTQLADAWKAAEAHLGPEALAKHAAAVAAGDGHEGEAEEKHGEARNAEQMLIEERMEIPDLAEGLRGPRTSKDATKGQKRALALAGEVEAGKAQKAGKRDGEGEEKEEGEEEVGPHRGAIKAQAVGADKSTEGNQQRQPGKGGQPSFVAAQKFAGARAGYCFKKGDQGLGYYVDKPPQVPRAVLMQQTARGKGPIIPISNSKSAKDDLSRFDDSSSSSGSSDDEEDEADNEGTDDASDSQGGSSDGGSQSDGSDNDHGMGDGGKKKGGRQVSDSSDSDSDEAGRRKRGAGRGRGRVGKFGRGRGGRGGEGRGGPRGGMGGRGRGGVQRGGIAKQGGQNKKLPGRLRKKLAKEWSGGGQ